MLGSIIFNSDKKHNEYKFLMTTENIKPKEAVQPLINALKDEAEQLVVVNY